MSNTKVNVSAGTGEKKKKTKNKPHWFLTVTFTNPNQTQKHQQKHLPSPPKKKEIHLFFWTEDNRHIELVEMPTMLFDGVQTPFFLLFSLVEHNIKA